MPARRRVGGFDLAAAAKALLAVAVVVVVVGSVRVRIREFCFGRRNRWTGG